jgi:hypothetical protein
MQLHVTTNKFNTEPFWIEPIRSVFACPPKQEQGSHHTETGLVHGR